MKNMRTALIYAFAFLFLLPAMPFTVTVEAIAAEQEEEREQQEVLPQSPAAVLESLAALPEIKNAIWAVSVRDTTTGKQILCRNADMNLVPASTMKLFVTAAALDKLGPDRKFRTILYYSGKIHGGVLAGNLLMRGGGDPSLGSEFLKNAEPSQEVFAAWAEALRKKGINRVEGAVIADSSLFEDHQPGSWAWEDIGNYYAAAPSALTIRDNLYRIYFDAGRRKGDPALFLRTDPVLPGMEFESVVTTAEKGTGDNVFIYSFPGIEKAVARGTLPLGAKNFSVKGALPSPALSAAREFTEFLRGNGIPVSADPVKGIYEKGYKKIAAAEGVPVRDIVRVTNKRSFNLYAEILLRHLAAASGKIPAGGDDGLDIIRSFLKELGTDVSDLKLVDACGLSRRNLVKASAFTSMLSAVSGKKYFNDYVESMVFPGDPEAFGHIKRFGRNLPAENLHIKSGSLNGVRSYAGYLKTREGRLLSFAFILNNYSGSAARLDSYQEMLLNALYETGMASYN